MSVPVNFRNGNDTLAVLLVEEIDLNIIRGNLGTLDSNPDAIEDMVAVSFDDDLNSTGSSPS